MTLSLSPSVDDAAYRAVTFDQVRDAYAEQIEALAEGGVDLLLIETIFDTLNAKAAIAAALDVAPDLPRWISFTAIDQSGRNLSGQTVEAFWASVEHADPLIVGVNCSLGAAQMRPYVESLSRLATDLRRLPSERGSPERARPSRRGCPRTRAATSASSSHAGLVNVVGGCCGTTPEHIAAIRPRSMDGLAPRRSPISRDRRRASRAWSRSRSARTRAS